MNKPLLTIKRIAENPDGFFSALVWTEATLGGYWDNTALCVSVERDSKDPRAKPLPFGKYVCKRYSSKKYPNTWQIMNVLNRTKMLFHAGNLEDDSLGCVLTGQSFGRYKNKRAVLSSRVALRKLMHKTRMLTEFDLVVEDCTKICYTRRQ